MRARALTLAPSLTNAPTPSHTLNTEHTHTLTCARSARNQRRVHVVKINMLVSIVFPQTVSAASFMASLRGVRVWMGDKVKASDYSGSSYWKLTGPVLCPKVLSYSLLWRSVAGLDLLFSSTASRNVHQLEPIRVLRVRGVIVILCRGVRQLPPIVHRRRRRRHAHLGHQGCMHCRPNCRPLGAPSWCILSMFSGWRNGVVLWVAESGSFVGGGTG